MNDQEAQWEQDRIERLLAKWIPLLALEHWAIAHDWERNVRTGGLHEIAASTNTQWAYEDARITWYLQVTWDRLDDAKLNRAVLHELLHIVVNEIGSDDHHEERVITHLERILVAAYPEAAPAAPGLVTQADEFP